jgi:hypothetical protein
VRKRKQVEIPPATKFDRFSDDDLIACIEAEMRRGGELFRGLSQPSLDPGWVLAEMETHTQTALAAMQALRRRVALVQSV